MAVSGLSPGTIRSMTRSAPEKNDWGEPNLNTEMSLLDKLNLLRLVAEDPPPDLDMVLDEIRKNGGETPSAVFNRMRTLVQPRLTDP